MAAIWIGNRSLFQFRDKEIEIGIDWRIKEEIQKELFLFGILGVFAGIGNGSPSITSKYQASIEFNGPTIQEARVWNAWPTWNIWLDAVRTLGGGTKLHQRVNIMAFFAMDFGI